jgi:regulator of protease activity HflC (stomatin/prohibitin superfamily)
MKFPGLVIAAVAIILGGLIFFGSWYQIDQGEEGVVLRNGAVVDTQGPGLHFKLPIIESVKEISLQSHTETFEQMESYSRDQQPAQIRLSVSYHIIPGTGAEVYAEYGGAENMIARLVYPRVPALFKNVFGQYDALSAIQQRAKLNADTLAILQTGIGDPIFIESVQVEDIKFSAAYENSIEEKQLATVEVQKRQQELAQQKVQAEITVTQAQAQADAQIAQATAEATSVKLAAEAEAYAIEIKGRAEATAIDQRGQALRDNPGVVALVQAEKWNGQLPYTMPPNSAVPFLDLTPPSSGTVALQ